MEYRRGGFVRNMLTVGAYTLWMNPMYKEETKTVISQQRDINSKVEAFCTTMERRKNYLSATRITSAMVLYLVIPYGFRVPHWAGVNLYIFVALKSRNKPNRRDV